MGRKKAGNTPLPPPKTKANIAFFLLKTIIFFQTILLNPILSDANHIKKAPGVTPEAF